MSHNVSHGRGGVANIGPDTQPYTDGEIVREGPVGDHGDGPYSSGRGGQGNIDAVGEERTLPKDDMVVPETATRLELNESHHYGRGGAGNEAHVHSDKADQHGSGGSGIGSKIKHILKPNDP